MGRSRCTARHELSQSTTAPLSEVELEETGENGTEETEGNVGREISNGSGAVEPELAAEPVLEIEILEQVSRQVSEGVVSEGDSGSF
jgi:hypothetical protein